MQVGVITPVMKQGEKGGAEAFYDGLITALRAASCQVDRIDVRIDESTFSAILESYVTCYDLNLRQYDLVISTKAPTYMVRHPNHVSYLLHTMRVFYDMFHEAFGAGSPEHHKQRQLIHAFDKHGLHPQWVRKHFTNGHTTYTRLYQADAFWRDIAFQALHHPPALEEFKAPRAGEYIFLPSRLHRWKRADLVIKAFKRLKHDILLKIAGTGEDESALRELAAGDLRIEFLGHVSEAQLLDLYAGAIVVPFVPLHEDYGLITIEAFRSKKPVLTCTDSGEPTYFVKDSETGFVVAPDPAIIAEKLAYCIAHPAHMVEMGEKGCASIAHITWDTVVSTLLAAAEVPHKRPRQWSKNLRRKRPVKVLITDNQCIEPAIGGGRLRLLGLYSTLTEGIEATYVGTYDWPGPKYRELQLSQRLREIDVPLSDAHFALNAHLNALLPGKTTVDVTIPWLIWSSPTLVDMVQRHAREAEVVIFSHPWMYGCLRHLVRDQGKLIIYDAHNCEALLREKLLKEQGLGDCLVNSVRWIEEQLCQESDFILACSREDKQAFTELYGVKPERIVVMPNGVDVHAIRPASAAARSKAKEELGLGPLTAIFIGSAYQPNVEAAQAIIDRLAPAHLDITFAIVGGVCDRLSLRGHGVKEPANVKLLGIVNNKTRNLAYAAADLALNPMFTGSGTNIKLLDFLAAGLPTISTPIGARGIANRHDACFVVDDFKQFSFWIRQLQGDAQLYRRLAANGRELAEQEYDWRCLSSQLGEIILELLHQRGESLEGPYFSVVIPSYERPQLLVKLFQLLNRQTFTDFEVIVVDQSAQPLAPQDVQCNFPLQYLHSDEPGATKARNTGIKHAKGHVIAFTDDDCEPDPHWLAKAYKYFQDKRVVGVEGLIVSDQNDEVRYRIVTNKGFEGLGFMTANLFIRKAILDKIGGFDERFEHPHFREDTDLAWRAMTYGQIPFGRNVQVVHPAHARDIQRESQAERTKFFVHDPLLFYKHLERYIQLLKAEGHYAKTAGFWDYFMEGMVRHKVSLPLERLRDFTTAEQFSRLQELIERCWTAGETSPEATQPAATPSESAEDRINHVLTAWLTTTMDTDGLFIPADLVVSEATAQLADALLEGVTIDILPTGEDNVIYFDTSRERYRFTLQLLLDQAKGRVLDLGCSPGHVAMALTKAGFDVYGVDLNIEYLQKYPSQEWIERLRIQQVAFEQESLPYPDEFFDYVIFTEVLEHIAIMDPLQILLEIRRLLKPGGRMILSTPNVANISNLLALIKGHNVFWEPGLFYGSLDRHNREYTPHEVMLLLEKAQFRSYQLAYINAPANWHAKTADAVYELLGAWQTSPEVLMHPLFKNTIFVRAAK